MKTKLAIICYLLSAFCFSVFAQGNANPPGVVKSVNGYAGQVTLTAGPGIIITPAGTGLTIGAQPMVPTNVWFTTGNIVQPGGFLGTLNDAPLEFVADGQHVLRIEPGGVSDYTAGFGNTNLTGAPNLIGGAPVNFVTPGVVGAVISGGGATNYFGSSNSNSISADFCSIGGGWGNAIGFVSAESIIGGGAGNQIQTNSWSSTICGGNDNTIQIDAYLSTIGGGSGNTIETNAPASTISGGEGNQIQDSAHDSAVGGGVLNRILSGARGSTIGGGFINQVDYYSYATFIGGGQQNEIRPACGYAAIGGGLWNNIVAAGGFIGGGGFDDLGHYGGNTNAGGGAVIVGGLGNNIQYGSEEAAIGGGFDNIIQDHAVYAAIAGGTGNQMASGAESSTIGGGRDNICQGAFAIIPGGTGNTAARSSFAAGSGALALGQGDFVWADDNTFDFLVSHNNQFAARCTGGAVFVTGIDGSGNTIAGVQVPAGSGSWSSLSDRNVKENFQAVDQKELLDHIAALPISSWNYKAQDRMIRHIGPTAQDFRAAFGVGEDDKHIATVDEGGVALAAIQGLNQKVEELKTQLNRRDAENTELKARLVKLEQLINSK